MLTRKKIGPLIAVLVLLAGCGVKNADSGKISVVATIFPAYDFARAIAGENADITMLISPGGSVHSYDPTPADIKKIADADVFIYNGGESDEWVLRLLSGTDMSAKKLVRLMDFVEPVPGMHEEPHGEAHIEDEKAHAEDEKAHAEEPEYDEHIWTSPKNAVMLVSAIEEALCEADASNAGLYAANAAGYIAEIEELDKDIRNIVETSGKNIIVVADRFPFRYLADEYGISHKAAFSGCSDQTDASVAAIALLVEAVRENNLAYIYYAELSSQNAANAVALETGAGKLLLHSCQNVSREELEAGETYVTLMRKNALNLKRGLN